MAIKSRLSMLFTQFRRGIICTHQERNVEINEAQPVSANNEFDELRNRESISNFFLANEKSRAGQFKIGIFRKRGDKIFVYILKRVLDELRNFHF